MMEVAHLHATLSVDDTQFRTSLQHARESLSLLSGTLTQTGATLKGVEAALMSGSAHAQSYAAAWMHITSAAQAANAVFMQLAAQVVALNAQLASVNAQIATTNSAQAASTTHTERTYHANRQTHIGQVSVNVIPASGGGADFTAQLMEQLQAMG